METSFGGTAAQYAEALERRSFWLEEKKRAKARLEECEEHLNILFYRIHDYETMTGRG